jgi:hypothetical protein
MRYDIDSAVDALRARLFTTMVSLYSISSVRLRVIASHTHPFAPPLPDKVAAIAAAAEVCAGQSSITIRLEEQQHRLYQVCCVKGTGT